MRGTAVQRTIYKPFGEKITVDEEGKKVSRSDSYTNRGYTGHESIQETENLIHMNGRIYDSSIGRFISADPHIQAPNDTQSYNRYSYVKNNPLKYTDPSGYFFSGLKKWFKKHWKSIVTTVATVAVGFLTAGASFIVQGAAIGFTAGAVGTLVNGGSLGSALKNGIIGGIFGAVGAGLSFGIGSSIGSLGGKALAHGATSAFMTRARGGKWNSGFWSGFAGTMLSPITGMAKGYYAKVASSAIVAGTISTISGGKFANGAFSGAFRFMFNEALHSIKDKITFNTAKYKYMNGDGSDISVKASSVDLSKVHASDFNYIGHPRGIQLFYHGSEYTNDNDALVYGGLTVVYAGEIDGSHYVAIKPDTYNFEMHDWDFGGESIRNLATLGARAVHFNLFRENKPFDIYFNGLSKISP